MWKFKQVQSFVFHDVGFEAPEISVYGELMWGKKFGAKIFFPWLKKISSIFLKLEALKIFFSSEEFLKKVFSFVEYLKEIFAYEKFF